MALTPDRTTVKAAVQQLVSVLGTNLTADPPTAAKPFRRVDEGPPDDTRQPRPILLVWVTSWEPESATEGDRILRVSAKMKLIVDVFDDDPHNVLLDTVAALEDYFDGLITGGTSILEGADGFEDRAWTVRYPTGSVGGRTASAECGLSFVVKVERGFNRVPNS